jgi:hypothetical protein
MQKLISFQFIKRLYLFILCIASLSGNFAAIAQTRRTVSPRQTPAAVQAAQKCSGAWTGTITYTRTQSMSDNKVTQRVSGRGEDRRDWQMKYDYKASIAVIESPERNSSSAGRANIAHSF